MTFRPLFILSLILLSAAFVSGCTNLLARRAIVSFADSLESHDLEAIKSTTSDKFASKALRQPEAIRDLTLMRVPQGDVKVLEIEVIDETTKKAIVQIGKGDHPKQVEYRLSLNSETGKWLVDDLIVGQIDNRGQEIKRSVTEQMDLLLTCREFLSDWQDAPRAERLAHCTDDLAAELNKLPPAWLNMLTTELIGPDRQKSFRPDARLNGDRAVVLVPHPEGSLFIEFHSIDNHWKVQNLAVEPKDENSTGVRSLVKLAQSLNKTAGFLTSFAGGDVQEIEKYATPEFFSRCLASGDFDRIEMPVAELIANAYESKQFQDRNEILIESSGATYLITLRNVDLPESEGKAMESGMRIDEVTIFEQGGNSVKKVSSMLLANSVVNLFVEALQSRNLAELKELSSNDFKERVWKRDSARHFVILPYPQLEPGEPVEFARSYRGEVTEISVELGSVPMTFVLLLSDDLMVVDDVIIPKYEYRPSMKANLELMLPIYEFATAVYQKDLKTLTELSAKSLDHIVWMQLNYVPKITEELIRPMMGEVVKIQVDNEWTTVFTSDGVTMAEIRMVPEGLHYHVHDVILSNERDPSQQFAFLPTVRKMISEGILLPKGARNSAVIQANQPKMIPEQSVQTTGFEPISREVYGQ